MAAFKTIDILEEEKKELEKEIEEKDESLEKLHMLYEKSQIEIGHLKNVCRYWIDVYHDMKKWIYRNENIGTYFIPVREIINRMKYIENKHITEQRNEDSEKFKQILENRIEEMKNKEETEC